MIDCQIHNKSYENICKDCTVLLCNICVVQHTRTHRDHSCYHIDEIKESLYVLDDTINNNDIHNKPNNNNDRTENYLKDELFHIWNTIKSSSHSNTLDLKDVVSNHFKQFHEYLIIEEHKLKSTITNMFAQQHQYTITIDNQSIDNAKQSIKKSIELTTNNTEDQNQQTEQSVTGIILSTNKDGKIATLLDTNNDNKVIEEIEFPYNTDRTFSSTVNTGEYVYLFGGYNKDMENKDHETFIRYSIAEKKIDHKGIIDTVDFGCNISACFDGDEYIYLIVGYSVPNKSSIQKIDRFHIKNMKFEKFYKDDFIANYTFVSHSFYNGSINMILSDLPAIRVFNPITKKTSYVGYNYGLGDNDFNPRLGCSDHRGNIYILSQNKEFIRYNFENMGVDRLSPLISDVDFQSMVYVPNRDNYKLSKVYVFGGVTLKNYFYSPEKNQWSPFYSEDFYDRIGCGSVLI